MEKHHVVQMGTHQQQRRIRKEVKKEKLANQLRPAKRPKRERRPRGREAEYATREQSVNAGRRRSTKFAGVRARF